MRKVLLIVPFLMGILIIGCKKQSGHNTVKIETPEFESIDLGQVKGNRYIHKENNLSFTFPEDWEAIDAKVIHKQKIEADPDFLTSLNVKLIDTINVLSLFMTEKNQRIENYDIIEHYLLTKEDSIKLKNEVSKEKYYQKNYKKQIEYASLRLELKPVKNSDQFKDINDYMENLRSKMSALMLQEMISTQNYDVVNNNVSELYNLKKLSDSTDLIGLDINYSYGSSLTGISLKKGDLIWNFQLFYFDETQKEKLINVVKSLKLIDLYQ
ncbi:hypothetical protein [Aquimarina aggregata]|uniref:hypothetical protein n=1 Tax=Aquimarina aggregata TaxID=1642818 RepID=UPI00249127C6|nr:hypothetical protein [Aquimarina aggregata]